MGAPCRQQDLNLALCSLYLVVFNFDRYREFPLSESDSLNFLNLMVEGPSIDPQ